MKITYKGDYALKAVLDLAIYYGSEAITINDIAKRIDAPVKFLEQVLLDLKKGGMNCPVRIHERQIGRPDQFAGVKPDRVAGHEPAVQQANAQKIPPDFLVESLPPDRYQPHARAQRDEGHDLDQPGPRNRFAFQP